MFVCMRVCVWSVHAKRIFVAFGSDTQDHFWYFYFFFYFLASHWLRECKTSSAIILRFGNAQASPKIMLCMHFTMNETFVCFVYEFLLFGTDAWTNSWIGLSLFSIVACMSTARSHAAWNLEFFAWFACYIPIEMTWKKVKERERERARLMTVGYHEHRERIYIHTGYEANTTTT